MKCHRRTGSGVVILQEALLNMPLGVVSECEQRTVLGYGVRALPTGLGVGIRVFSQIR